MKVTHKVEFFYQGTLFDETDSRVVQTQNPEKVVVPKHAFAFQFFHVTEQEASLEDGRMIKHKESKTDDKMYYPGATVMTEADIKRDVADNRILLSNIRCNGWKKVIRSRTGNFKPYIAGKTIVI